MLLNISHKSYFAQIIWVIVFAILFTIPDYFVSDQANWSNNTLFFKISCIHPLLNISWIYTSFQLLLLLGSAFIVKFILTQNQLIHHSNFLPAILIIALFGFYQLFDLQLLSSINLFLLVMSYTFLLKSFDDEKPDNSIFSASLFIGLASFISYTNVTLLVLIWISFFVFQNYSWRYLPITIIGFIAPYIFLATYLYWHDQLMLFVKEWYHIQDFIYQLPRFTNLFYIIILTFLVFLTLLSLAKIIPETSSKIISIRKKVNLSLWFLFIGFVLFLFSTDTIVKNVYLIPLSGLLGYYLRGIKTRKRLIDFVFSLLIIILLFQKYYFVYVTVFAH